MSQAVYELLQRHPDCLDNALLIGNGADFPPGWLALLKQRKTHWLCWDWQTYQAAQALGEAAVTFAVPQQHIREQQPQRIILLWPKAKMLALNLVELIASQLPADNTEVYVVGANDAGGKSIGKACQPFTQHNEKLDSARRCSLWRLQLSAQPEQNWLKKAASFPHQQHSYLTLPGVFSHGKLDSGTRVLLEHLPAPAHGRLLDLGCGSGVIGLSLKKVQPALDVTLADVDAFALRSAELNSMRLGLETTVVASNGLASIEGRFDYIISNPPFHQGKETDYRFAENLLRQAKQHLVNDGQLWIVANRHLGYEEWAQQHFQQCEQMAQQEGFKILCLSQPR